MRVFQSAPLHLTFVSRHRWGPQRECFVAISDCDFDGHFRGDDSQHFDHHCNVYQTEFTLLFLTTLIVARQVFISTKCQKKNHNQHGRRYHFLDQISSCYVCAYYVG